MEPDALTEPLRRLKALQDEIRLDQFHRYLRYRSDRGRWVSYNGVTSIIGILDKPALQNWTLKQEREHDIKTAFENPPQPNEDAVAYKRRFEAVAGKVGAFRQTSDHAAARGHVVHAAIEALMRKRLGWDYEVPEMSEHERTMFKRFVQWELDNPLTPLLPEARLCDDDLFYAGTGDLLALVNDTLTLVDFKTSKASKTTYPEHSLQSGAYRGALVKLGFPPMRGLIVQVDRDCGPTRSHWLEDDHTPAYEAFGSLLATQRYLEARDSLLPPPEAAA